MRRELAFRLLKKLDNLSVRRKIVLSYVLGFVLPLLLVSTVTWTILRHQAASADRQQAAAALNLTRGQVAATLEAGTSLADLLSNDSLITTALDDYRIDRLGHLLQYRLEIQYYLGSYVTAYPQVDRVEFFTTNPAILRGGSILLIDESIEGAAWLQALRASKRQTISAAHIEPSLISPRRVFSLVRQMTPGDPSRPGVESIMRVDISLAHLNRVLRRSAPFGTVYVVDSANRIIAANVPTSPDQSGFPTYDEASLSPELPVRLEEVVETDGPFANLRVVGHFPNRASSSLGAYLTWIAVVTALLSVLIASLIQFAVGYSLSRRLQLLTSKIESTTRDNFPAVHEVRGRDEVGILIGAYNRMTQTIDRLMKEVYEEGLTVNRLAVEKRHAELEALFSKIDPHFLSNSLNTIRMRSLSRGERETANALKALARLFDYLTAWQDEVILVRHEAEFIRGFLSLQQYRFGDNYEYEVAVDPAALDLPLPRMMVQPLVENASEHGVERVRARGFIQVAFQKHDDRLVVTVTDNGKGMDKETIESVYQRLDKRSLDGKSIGMQNVFNRLHLLFGEDAYFDLQSVVDKGTTVTLSFPYGRLEHHVESYSR
ncbi:MAG: histidine kinase [Spirochaetales bacterium]